MSKEDFMNAVKDGDLTEAELKELARKYGI